MPTYTSRLKLTRRVLGEPFRLQDYIDNWNAIDASPGVLVATSGTLPDDWDNAETGREVIETDTGLRWWWDGTDFVRTASVGLLGVEKATTPINTTSTSLVDAIEVEVEVPPGGRAVEVTVSGPGAYNTNGLARLALFRDSTQLQSWLLRGELADGPLPVSMTVLDDSVVSGTATYTLRYSAVSGTGGTSHVQADTDTPLVLYVKEV